MAEPTSRHSAVAELRAAMAAASVDGVVTLAEMPACDQLSLRGPAGDPAFLAGVQDILGFALPPAANDFVAEKGVAVLWLGPDEWLLVCDAGSGLADRMAPALIGHHAALVDVSAARTVLELDGPKAAEVLAKGCGLDLHPRAFGPGRCAQTLLARVPVILQQTDQAPTYILYVRPSLAAWLTGWLMDAMREYR